LENVLDRPFLLAALATSSIMFVASSGAPLAQDYAHKPTRMIVPFVPGGARTLRRA
jgi:tripartite-type tricarboxylate transporter receptor subunit TctC